jgi:DNA polymerase-3 subunit chi
MTQIGFYHLTRTDVASALPALLGRSLGAGKKVLVLCGSKARVEALDAALWLSQNPDWLPHGTAATPRPDWQPVYISEVEVNPAGAKFLFLVDGVSSADVSAYTRVFDLFDGNDEESVAAARMRWKLAKDAGHDMVYWKQGPGGWEKAG